MPASNAPSRFWGDFCRREGANTDRPPRSTLTLVRLRGATERSQSVQGGVESQPTCGTLLYLRKTKKTIDFTNFYKIYLSAYKYIWVGHDRSLYTFLEGSRRRRLFHLYFHTTTKIVLFGTDSSHWSFVAVEISRTKIRIRRPPPLLRIVQLCFFLFSNTFYIVQIKINKKRTREWGKKKSTVSYS